MKKQFIKLSDTPVTDDSPIPLAPPLQQPIRFYLSIAIVSIMILACSIFVPQKPTPDPTATIEPTPQIDLDKINIDYIYRSDLISIIYPLYGSILDDFTIVTITNTNELPVKIMVSSEVQGFTMKSVDTITVDAQSTEEIRQNPRLDSIVFERLNVEQPAQFRIEVSALENGEEKILLEESGETLVFARRDFPWSIPGMTEQEDFELLAAMVTPNDPAVEQLLRYAADYTQSGSMWGGYNGVNNDEDSDVWERLEAIWKAEQNEYGLTYLSTLVTYAPGDIQRIRLARETLEQRAGNCIDLALLYASAAEAIRLEPAIIGIPGHAFVAIRTDQINSVYYFIETTLIGQSDFSEAVSMGKDEWYEVKEKVENSEPSYNWVTIADARAKGILPLPWP
ncbi:MAG: hypothetical protein ANABAC_3006 [Anaerolineae bacterium]|nr:MAG: hypothetical protein ANABAC_3006 [Anaerolineae bacterium]